jgi:hypothetical protein
MTPSPAPANPPPVAVPAAATDGKHPQQPVEDDLVEAAHQYYLAILSKNSEKLALLSRAPFFFEGKPVNSESDIKRTWENSLANQPLEGLRLSGVAFYTPEEMAARFGKPPDKLSGWPMKGGMLSVANLSGHAAIVLWRKNGALWQAFAFHD